MAFFSIIIPFYNVKPYLSACLDSLLAQDFKDFEAILVNDGSDDGSREVAQEYRDKDSRFILIEQENSGPSTARNKALEYISSTCESKAMEGYILFLDSDDFLAQDTLERLYTTLMKDAKDADILLLDYHLCDKNKNVTHVKSGHLLHIFNHGRIDVDYFIHTINNAGCLVTTIASFVVKKSYFFRLNIYFPTHIFYEDVYFCTHLIARAEEVYVSNICGFYYRQSPNSIMRGKMDTQKLHHCLSSYLFLTEHFAGLTSDNQRIARLYRMTSHLCFQQLIILTRQYGYTRKFPILRTIPYVSRLSTTWKIRYLLGVGLSPLKRLS